ncbi:hypothetical protein [Ochrobactrum quorumnocens]|nr:hypothetical protein [[Ochrobactrum] quorumnocens]
MGTKKSKRQKDFDNIEEYIQSDSDLINEVRWAAQAYLSHAENAMKFELGKVNFLDINHWYIVHHISYISVELFLKSFYAKLTVHIEEDFEITDDYRYEFSDNVYVKNFAPDGHFDIHKNYPEDLLNALKEFISVEEWQIVESMSFDELTRGRYPYEENSQYVSEEDAFSYLSLARKLSKFQYNI